MSKSIQLKENHQEKITRQRSPFFFKLAVVVGLSAAAACIAHDSISSTFYTYNITYKDGSKKEVLSTTPPKEYLRIYGDKVRKTEISSGDEEIVVNVDMDLTESEARDREFDSTIEKMVGKVESKEEKKPEPPQSPIKAIKETVQTVKDFVKVAAPIVEVLAKKPEEPKPQIKPPVRSEAVVKVTSAKKEKAKPKAVIVKAVVPEKPLVADLVPPQELSAALVVNARPGPALKKEKKKTMQIVKAETVKPEIVLLPKNETFMATVTLEEYERVERYSSLIKKYAKKRGLDPDLVKALVLQESRGDPKCKSKKGAIGLMQLMPATARMLDPTITAGDLYDPEKNLSLGTKHLKNLITYYKGDVVKAIAAYNAGNGAVDDYNGIPPYPETQEFVRCVLSFYRSLDAGIPPV